MRRARGRCGRRRCCCCCRIDDSYWTSGRGRGDDTCQATAAAFAYRHIAAVVVGRHESHVVIDVDVEYAVDCCQRYIVNSGRLTLR